ncbi:DUF2007 domain-containing protein [Polaribacter litorisediminis]|uniref:putative signal transducing protein n=1 Tax=Polaribacter litorisediminis TaxID=1908341 RepID=UPI001CBAF54D|nr:DUF2007 domain-containing protein [Polaribacter litorisediminis]UAM98689.1 DUF2007 domain-containing protein [Polaribacter litorisediminis]
MNDEHVKLFTESNIIISGLKNLLENENISYLIKDKFESARLGGFGEQAASVEIHVLKKDLKEAKKILAAYKEKISL